MNKTVKRTISGIAFILVMIAGLFINEFTFAGLMVFVLITMMNEFYDMTMGKEGFKVIRLYSIFCGVLFFVGIYAHVALQQKLTAGALALPIILLVCATVHVYNRDEFNKVAYLFTGLAYVSVPISLSSYVVFRTGEYSGLLLLLFFIIIWASDTGAYCLGCTLGKNGKKMCPAISPNKSWWGFVGGLIFAEAAAVAMHFLGYLDFPLLHCIALGAIMHVAGVYGDLFESQWKRFCGVKDSGNVIPGHGGLLDRFDSSLIAIPAGVAFLVVTNLF